MSLTTIYLGSRLPKQYEKDSDPANPNLSADQPGEVKCRIKMRLSPDGSIEQHIAEARLTWELLDHGSAPAWISGTDDDKVKMLALMLGIKEIRPCEPAEGDE